MAEHLTFNQRVRGSNPLRVTILCGCSSMVELQPSKLTTWVRFPSPAPFYIKKCLNSSAVEQSAVNRSVGGSNPSSSASGRLEKRLTHMPFTHAFTGSNPVPVTIYGGLAQLGEHLPYKQRVSGSSPLTSTIFLPT